MVSELTITEMPKENKFAVLSRLTGLDFASVLGPPYIAMRLLRPISIILGLAILLINTGDCVNLLFANTKEADCCLRADCPFAGQEQMDSCCTTPKAPGKYIQAAAQKSLTQPSVTYVDFPAVAIAAPILNNVAYFPADAKLHSPPNGLNALNTPLLI